MLYSKTPIPTPSGWTTMGELQAGDWIFDEQGCPSQVLIAYPIDENPVSYRLAFDDGSEILACADHLWLTYNAAELMALTRRDPEWREKRREKRPSRVSGNKSAKFTASLIARNKVNPPDPISAPCGSIRTTKEIAETLFTGTGRKNHAIPVSAPLITPEIELPLDPYCLGAWLGDGSKNSGGLTGIDKEIWEEFEKCGYQVTHNPKSQKGHYIKGLVQHLRTAGVFKNKHIPKIYLRASQAQRLALLQGLMDTDGTVYESGSVEFTNTNKQIIDGIYELIVSLGWKARVVEGRAKLYGRDCGAVWNIKWTPSEYVFRLPRKRNAQKLATRRTTRFRYIVACEAIDPVPMRCIAVNSPSHLYLAGKSMIPTHNSEALLMAALQYVDTPGYDALIVRRSYSDLNKPEAIMNRLYRWLFPYRKSGELHWNANDHRWTFPSGATINFGYLERAGDEYQYQGAEFQTILFDELTQFPEAPVLYLFSRLRRKQGSKIPLRFRSASNPGGVGHEWVKQRYIVNGRTNGKIFIPSLLTDNPGVDQAEYLLSLSELDYVTRKQLLEGDWDAAYDGGLFKRDWFKVVDDIPHDIVRKVRHWDLAATEPSSNNPDPDWTAGLLMAKTHDNRRMVLDVVRDRRSPGGVEALIKATANQDGKEVDIIIEQEPGSAGVNLIDRYVRDVLPGYRVRGSRPSGDKFTRAKPLSSQLEYGNVTLKRGPWNADFINECVWFDGGSSGHDDQVDAFSGAYEDLLQNNVVVYSQGVVKGRGG